MDDLKKHLDKKLRSLGILKLAQSAWVVLKANELNQGQYQVVSFKEGVLTIKTKTQSQASHLLLESQKIINEINQALKEPLVKRIRFMR